MHLCKSVVHNTIPEIHTTQPNRLITKGFYAAEKRGKGKGKHQRCTIIEDQHQRCGIMVE